MKKLIVIGNHSFVDVITNSSSELFVLDTDKSLDMFKALLNELIEEYNLLVEAGFYDERYGNTVYPGRKANLDDFDEPYVYTKEMYENHLEQDEKYRENDRLRNEQRIKDGKEPWDLHGSYLWGYETEENIGKIFLESSSDNSIPYDMWEMINDRFNGVNYHLG